MPKVAKELSAVQVARITARGVHPVGVVPGLLLAVAKGGTRSWILRARIGERRRDIGLGGYPAVTLAGARAAARDERAKIRAGIDVVAERRASRQAKIEEQRRRMTFVEAAREKHKALEPSFRSAKHARLWLSALERHAFPVLGKMDVADISTADVLHVLRPIWTTKTDTAKRVRQRIEAVLNWATVARHRQGDNPARWRGNLAELLPQPGKVAKTTHRPALPWQDVPAFMVELRKRDGMGARALEFAILTAARSGEVRGATWAELDLGAGAWTVPGERMKMNRPHAVPLSPAALTLLRALPRMAGSDYVFPAARGGQLSDMSVSAVCRRMGVNAVPHGFRSSFKDWARNRTAYADEVSELCLAHVSNDATRAAYARDGLLPQRARLLAEWAKYIETKPATGNVVALRKGKKA